MLKGKHILFNLQFYLNIKLPILPGKGFSKSIKYDSYSFFFNSYTNQLKNCYIDK